MTSKSANAKVDPQPTEQPGEARPIVEPSRPGFPIVGIGASAGGLAAFEAFFSGIPAETNPGIAFVLIQHLDPDHKSLLTELIGRSTHLQVFEVEDGMMVQPDCVYIIPPKKDMAFIDGTLQLLEPAAPRGRRLPIDFFFRSLADELHERAVCIILSGTGSDGTEGLRAVKGEGGMAMAQTPEGTEFSGMPSSAIATGLVDFILPPDEMANALLQYISYPFAAAERVAPGVVGTAEDEIRKVLVLLRSKTGNDFTLYKPSTVTRRIDRRMAINQIDRVTDYVRLLQREPKEIDALFRDMLIGVTSFFRDPEVFAILQETVIPQILQSKAPGEALRVWIPACSTGEEAYSFAILIQEQIDALKTGFEVKIFATDLDPRAIEKARSGVYPAGIAADVSAERLERFFTHDPETDLYRVNKSVRDLLIFSEQNVIKDPPFSQVDIISCRNLLIYLSSAIQNKLIPMFHYALKPDGYLCVGTSESDGGFSRLFTAVSGKAKIYQRKGDVPGADTPRIEGYSRRATAERGTHAPRVTRSGPSPLRGVIERELLARTGLVAALVNQRGEILYLHGRTGHYLEPSPGKPGSNILKMARPGLGRALATALRLATSQVEPVTRADVRVKTNGDYTAVTLTVNRVAPTGGEDDAGAMYLVVFEESPTPPGAAAITEGELAETGGVTGQFQIQQLTRELQAKEEYLQTALEEMETSNEELQSTNEELQSTNEELQATNEELETSKEELQSVNEELATVNAELQHRVKDLSRVNNDMNNLLAGTGIGIIFVDGQLRLQRFTPAATRVINLIPGDVGRPVGHIVSNLVGYACLEDDARAVMETLESKEIEVEAKTGEWYLLRIRPYRTLENVIDGVAITFTDISELKRVQLEFADSKQTRMLATVVIDSNDAILVYDMVGRIIAWNPRATRMYGWSEEEALTKGVSDLVPRDSKVEELAVLVRLANDETIAPYRTQRVNRDGGTVEITLTATALVDENGTPYAITTTERGV